MYLWHVVLRCSTNVEPTMAGLTGLFQRGSSYYIQVVLPADHPLQNRYKNGKFVVSLGHCSHREALLRGTIKRAEVLLGGASFTASINTAVAPPSSTLPAKLTRLRDVHLDWKNSKVRSEDTISACLRAVNLFEVFTGNTLVCALTRKQGEDFRSWLEHPDRKTTSKTARDRLIWVKSLLEFAAHDLELIRKSPWSGIEIAFQTTNMRRPWTDEELTKLFTQPLHALYELPKDRKAGADAAYWIPLLGLYTGARVGELAQLRTIDIGCADGVPMLSITNEGDGQQVKTAAGVRKVPLHSEVIRLGFLDYVAEHRKNGEATLWPALTMRQGKPGGYFSHWFGIYRRALGFGKCPDFHCFRHTVRSQLANAGVAEALIDTLVGHEVTGSTGAKVYTHRTPQTLTDAIAMLSYPTLSLPRVC
jgi:integrase